MKNEHRFNLLRYRGARVKIDTEIVPLIQQLWDRRLDTCNSCQDNSGYVWIEFSSAQDAETFLTAIAQSADEDLSYKAKNPIPLSPADRYRLSNFGAPEDSWLINADAFADDQSNNVTVSVGIRFPRDQLALVMSALALT
jgi:hypothetical protein